MVAFYNKADQELYKKYQYLPQERYRLGFTEPTIPTTEPVSSGITNTNSFTNSGGNDFNITGNAFGYGSPVSEVNVRTFDPQKLDGPQMPPELTAPSAATLSLPSGNNISASQLGASIPGQQVRNVYNRARNAMEARGDDSMSKDYPQFTNAQVAKFANNSISDYRQTYGAAGQYVSPYHDTVDQSKYTTTIGNFPSRGFFNRMKKRGFDLAENIPFLGIPTRIIKKITGPQEDRGPGGGTYAAAGMSDAQKKLYNALARDGMLFDGSGGLKTLTGKNFMGKGYLEGQQDLAINKFKFDTKTDEEIQDEIAKLKNEKTKQFLYKQMKEAAKIYQTNKPDGSGGGTGGAGVDTTTSSGTGSGYTGTPGGNTGSGNFANIDNSGKTYGPHSKTSTAPKYNSKDDNRESYRGRKDGGRIGYFFGGRVNFKNGGLASIL